MKNWSGIFDLLNPDNTMTFNRLIAHSIGAVETIIYFALISKCRYWEINDQLVDGEWFYSTTYDLQESTTFSEYQQKKAINKLEKLDLIRCTTKGIPAKRCFVINDDLNLLYSIIEDGRKISEQLHEKALEKNYQKSAQRKLKSELSKNPEKRSSEVFLDKSVSTINTSLISSSQNSVKSSSEKNAEQVLVHNLSISPQINCDKSSSEETSEQVPKKIENRFLSNCRTSPAVSQEHTYNLNKNNLNENNLSYPINQSTKNFKDMQYYPEEERNFETLIGMLADSTTSENDENYKNGIDLMFEALEQEQPGCFAVNQYKQYKLAAGKTAKSILISCGARLAPFAIREVLEITSYDEIQLDTIGDRKTALFIIISDTDSTFNFLVAMMYSQMFNLLCTKADNNPDGSGKLKQHVRCILDEFANIGQIPDFEKLIATIRSREISASIILQSQSQLKAIYKDNADTIIGNCDTTLFLGGKEKSTLKEISESLDKATIDTYNTSDTRGQNRSYGMNYQKLGRELMTAGEIQKMDGAKCILQIRGVKPFFSNKFDITKHTNYKYLLDYDKNNLFNIEKFVNRKLPVKKSTVADTYEIEV